MVTHHDVIVHGFLHGLGEVQVQVHVLLFAADGVVTLTAGASRDVLPQLPVHRLLLTPRVRDVSECKRGSRVTLYRHETPLYINVYIKHAAFTLKRSRTDQTCTRSRFRTLTL